MDNFENSNSDNKITVYAVNRDGDLGYIECPECHSLDLNKKTIFMCRDCGQHFTVYLEDGLNHYRTCVGSGIVASGKIKLTNQEDKYHHTYIMPREYDSITKDMDIITLNKDLQPNGKDAHGHEFYKRVTIIEESENKPLNRFNKGV